MVISERHTYKRIDQLIKLVFPFILAIVCMLLFEGYDINLSGITSNQRLAAKKNAVISCGPGQLLAAANNHVNDTDPENQSNGNNCTHRQGANSLCETMGSRRRPIKFMPVEDK